MLFPEAPTSSGKKIEIIFAALYFYCMSSEIVTQISKFLFQIGDINNFVLFVISFSRYIQIKRFFSDGKNSGEI